ncbi:MAG: restriction endonuclease subunit S [Myxococcales bacterium]|nr:restriction endonuclease subunit S [Myxococcales bacterium]
MNLDTFFEKFDLFADAPNAVAKMRELILWLAVRGKLSKQKLGEESGQELLARIWRDLAQQKNITKPSSCAIDATENLPSLPISWTWARFCEIAIIASNLVNPNDYLDSIHLAPDNIEKGTGKLLPCRTIRDDEVKSSKHRFFSGQIVYSKIRPNLAKVVIVNFDGLCSADMYPIDSLIDAKFLQIFMLSDVFLAQSVKNDTRVAMPKINQAELNAICVSVPPLTEQKRIVAKVDELMALCDRLEAQQQERETRHTALAQASLTRFADAPTPANLELLFHKSYSIEPAELRKSILTLAVRGKLVAQNFDDESPHNLLTRTSDSSVVENEYEIPPNWLWTSLEDIADIGTGSTPSRTESSFWSNGTVPWITSGATGKDVISSADEYVTHAAVKAHRLRIYPAGTLIVAMYGQGKTRGQVSVLGMESTINQACAAIGFSVDLATLRCYVKILLMKQYDEMRSLAAGGAQPNLNLQKIKEIKVPLPPLPEQKRIVAKVEQLMGLVDRLEAQLAESRGKAAALLEAVVAELSGAG